MKRWLWACGGAWALLAAAQGALYLGHGPPVVIGVLHEAQSGVILAAAYILGRIDADRAISRAGIAIRKLQKDCAELERGKDGQR